MGTDEGARAAVDEFRLQLGQNGYRLASNPAEAMLFCELCGTVQDRSAVPGAVVSAHLTARRPGSSETFVSLTSAGNGIGSTPDAAAFRAYRNAATDLFNQFDKSVPKGKSQ